MGYPTATVPSGSRAALVVLVALIVLSPWPFGSALPITRWLITLICLSTSLGIALLRLWRREGVEVPLPAVLTISVFLAGFGQLIPLPAALHAFLAPASAALWHPTVPAAAEILGGGPRPISIWPEVTRRSVAFGLGVSFLTVLAMPALRERQRLLRAAVAVVASGLAVAVYGLVARLVFGEKLFGVLAVPTIAPFGPFVSKNHFAGYVELAALLALGLAVGLGDEARRCPGAFGWVGSRRAPQVVATYGGVAALSLAVLVSQSRGGATSLAVGIAAFAVWRLWRGVAPGRRWRSAALVGASAVTVLVGAYLVLPQEARQRLGSITAGSEDASAQFRAGIWKDCLGAAMGSPLIGYGIGTFVDALPRFKTGAGDMRVEHAEDDYLEILTEVGVTGLALVLTAGVIFGVRSRSDALRRAGPFRQAAALGGTAGLLALAVHSLVDFNLRIPSNSLLFAFLAAAVLAARAPSRGSRGPLTALAALCLLTLVMVIPLPAPRWINTRAVTSLAHSHLSITALRARQVEGDLRRFVNARPGDAEAWIWLGWSQASLGQREHGSALASYGASLDPQRRGLGLAAERLSR